jgi:hypothetical protein
MSAHASGTSHRIVCCVVVAGSISGSAQPSNTLQPPSAFAAISDPAERSRAIFAEAAKVLTHPRCMNCHPATDRVLQGDDKHPHQPVATRQTPCVTCHTDRNFTLHESKSIRSCGAVETVALSTGRKRRGEDARPRCRLNRGTSRASFPAGTPRSGLRRAPALAILRPSPGCVIPA